MITTILPTDQCNLKCEYCNSRKGHNTMTTKTLYNTIYLVFHVHEVNGNDGHVWYGDKRKASCCEIIKPLMNYISEQIGVI